MPPSPKFSFREMEDLVAIVVEVKAVSHSSVSTEIKEGGRMARVSFLAEGRRYSISWNCGGAIMQIVVDTSPENLAVKLFKATKEVWTSPAVEDSTKVVSGLENAEKLHSIAKDSSLWMSKLSDAAAQDVVFSLD